MEDTMDAPKHFVICGHEIIGHNTQRIFWSNEDGWVNDEASATVFNAAERWVIDLPMGATVIRWKA